MNKPLLTTLIVALFVTNFLGCQYWPFSKTINKNQKESYVLKPVWVDDTLQKKNTGFRKVNLFTPIIYQDSVIVANAFDGLVSYNRKTHNEVWRVPVAYGVEASGITFENKLFVGGLNGVMHAIDMNSGLVIWRYDSKAEIASAPIIEQNSLYFLNGANSLFSLDATSGKLNWVYNRQETTTKMTVRGASRPTLSAGIVYSGFSDGALVALSANTGTVQWEVQLNSNSRFKDIDASPVIDGDHLYINSYDDKIYCLSKAGGQIVWKYNAGGATAPLVTGQQVIFSSSNEEILALGKNDGKLLWKKPSKGIGTEPVILKDVVIFGESQGELKAVNPRTGDTLSTFDPGRGIMSKPHVQNDQHIYFISGEGNFYQVDYVPQYSSQIPFLVH